MTAEPEFKCIPRHEPWSIEKVGRGLHSSGMDDLKQHLARALRTARIRKGLTQEAVAEKVGVTTETISNTERAQSLLTLDVFLRLVDLLDIELTKLIGVPPAARRTTPKRGRLESELVRLGEEMTDLELELLIRIGKLLRGNLRS